NALLSFFARPGTRLCVLTSPYTRPLLDMGGAARERALDLSFLRIPRDGGHDSTLMADSVPP
ncbi:hypothetical protein, partial [Ideonella dechloratans]|uniref:hypothetical protein n=1 Tax=Ideonella dechloratans TaxID=36863 RepID=UPI0014789F2A